MSKYLFILIAVITIISCNTSSVKPSESIAGVWSVTDYQNQVLVQLPQKEMEALQESIKRQAQKLIEFAEFRFNEDGTYHLIYSPMDFDKGQWQIAQDTLLIYSSKLYNAIDTSTIHFRSQNEADILMNDPTQSITVSIKRK